VISGKTDDGKIPEYPHLKSVYSSKYRNVRSKNGSSKVENGMFDILHGAKSFLRI
jgi:hypothetical protein